MMHKELAFPTPIYVFDYGNSSILQSPLDHVLKCDSISSVKTADISLDASSLPSLSTLSQNILESR